MRTVSSSTLRSVLFYLGLSLTFACQFPATPLTKPDGDWVICQFKSQNACPNGFECTHLWLNAFVCCSLHSSEINSSRPIALINGVPSGPFNGPVNSHAATLTTRLVPFRDGANPTSARRITTNLNKYHRSFSRWPPRVPLQSRPTLLSFSELSKLVWRNGEVDSGTESRRFRPISESTDHVPRATSQTLQNSRSTAASALTKSTLTATATTPAVVTTRTSLLTSQATYTFVTEKPVFSTSVLFNKITRLPTIVATSNCSSDSKGVQKCSIHEENSTIGVTKPHIIVPIGIPAAIAQSTVLALTSKRNLEGKKSSTTTSASAIVTTKPLPQPETPTIASTFNLTYFEYENATSLGSTTAPATHQMGFVPLGTKPPINFTDVKSQLLDRQRQLINRGTMVAELPTPPADPEFDRTQKPIPLKADFDYKVAGASKLHFNVKKEHEHSYSHDSTASTSKPMQNIESLGRTVEESVTEMTLERVRPKVDSPIQVKAIHPITLGPSRVPKFLPEERPDKSFKVWQNAEVPSIPANPSSTSGTTDSSQANFGSFGRNVRFNDVRPPAVNRVTVRQITAAKILPPGSFAIDAHTLRFTRSTPTVGGTTQVTTYGESASSTVSTTNNPTPSSVNDVTIFPARFRHLMDMINDMHNRE